MKAKKKKKNDLKSLELTLADGKTHSFASGYDMYSWAKKMNSNWEFYEEGKDHRSLTDWFNERNSKKINKKTSR